MLHGRFEISFFFFLKIEDETDENFTREFDSCCFYILHKRRKISFKDLFDRTW